MLFFLRHVYKNDLNVLIEQWPNSGLVQALYVKLGLCIYSYHKGARDWLTEHEIPERLT